MKFYWYCKVFFKEYKETKNGKGDMLMKVIVAIDSFKGSLTSMEAGNAVKAGIAMACPEAEVLVLPLADGGEGTMEALVMGMNGQKEHITVTGPLGEPLECEYGILKETKTAVLEMASAAGLALVPEEKRNPMYTTTFGVGEIIKDAVLKGCRHFLAGIGGSATNDGGAGMLQALGFGMLDREGRQISFGAVGLRDLVKITDDQVLPELKECDFKIACDVINPLCGENGCSMVFGRQKGADDAMIGQMDQWLQHYAQLSHEKYAKADACKEGTGAAGGMGFAFLTYTNAVLESGIKIVTEETRLVETLRDADLVVTGEGRLDGQTIMGKAPVGVARLAKKYGKPVIAFNGCVTPEAAACNAHGIDAYFPILQNIVTQKEAMEPDRAKANMTAAVNQVFRLIKTVSGKGWD